MKTTTLVLLMVLGTSTAFGKQLAVVCDQKNPSIANLTGSALGAVMEIENINSTPVLQQLYIGGIPANQGKVASSEITKNTAQLSLRFGQSLYSSAKISIQDCQDSFSATGIARVEKYVGGFAGTEPSDLVCTCELK